MRVFVVDGREFPDPDTGRSVEEVKGMMSDFFPELSNAEVQTTQRGEDQVVEFVRRVGTKGGHKEGQRQLVVTIQCERCQALLFRKVYGRYQTRWATWGRGIRIATKEIEPHDCPNPLPIPLRVP
mgnify:CR=1 FL=1